MIMYSPPFLKGHTQILVRSGNWLWRAFNIFTCKLLILFLMLFFFFFFCSATILFFFIFWQKQGHVLNVCICMLKTGLTFSAFHYRILSMYDIQEEDLDGFTEHSQFLVSAETSSLQTQLPVIEILKVVTKIFLLFVFTV